MRALLDDRAAVEHDNQVRMPHRREPVRDDQRRAAGKCRLEVLKRTAVRPQDFNAATASAAEP